MSQKLGFIQPLSELVLTSETTAEVSTDSPDMFKISFQLSRITKTKSPNQKIYFSTLKQTAESGINYYYLIGIDENGFISLKKIFFDGSRRTTQWTLSNNHVSINYLPAVKISFKLSDTLIEININDEYMSRYEIIDNQANMLRSGMPQQRPKGFHINEIKFANTFLNNSELFMLYDLEIMDRGYEFINENGAGVTVNLLQDNRHTEEQVLSATRFKLERAANIMLFNTTAENLEIVSFLNKHYCPHAQSAKK